MTTNNDNLRRLRYALDLSNATMLDILAGAGAPLTPERLAALFRDEEDPGYVPCSNELFGRFLDGLIASRRGVREAPVGEAARPRLPMNNNRVLRSIRIALELTGQDMIDIMALADVRISKGELNALFRKPNHQNYRACGDQFLRNFLRGLGVRQRQGAGAT